MTFEELQTRRSYESSSNEIANYDQNKIIEAITQVTNNEDLLQHYLAADNTYAGGSGKPRFGPEQAYLRSISCANHGPLI